jgi:high affinity sulfate transporter 1
MSEERTSGPNVPLLPFAVAYGGRSPFASASKPPIVHRYVPLVRSLRSYSGERLRVDVVAGLTVAALSVPAAMAYAEVAGLPLSAGLYGLLLPVLAYAFLGSSPRVVIGPEGAVSLLVASSLAPLAAAGSPEYTALAGALAIAVGVVFLAARLVRIGWIADYFSQSVLVGYITGVAILMILGQFGKLVGLSSQYDKAIRATVDIVSRIGEANPQTVVVAVLSLGLLVLLRRLAPRAPGALVVVALSILMSWWLDLSSYGVSVTGSIPSGLPALEIPDVSGSQVVSLIAPAFAIFLLSFSDSILTARSFAARHRERVDADQELQAFSLANVAAGFSGGYPVGTSGSRTAVNDSMKVTSQVSGLVSIGAVGLVLLFFTAPIQYLPSAVLGAIIVFASVRLIDPRQWRALARSSYAEVAIAVITAVCVVTIGVLPAIVVAVALSVLDVIRRAAQPNDGVLGYSVDDGRYADVATHPDAGITPGVVVYRMQDRLFFANVHFFKRRLWAAVDAAPKPVRFVVLDAASISGADASASEAVSEIIEGLHDRNITLAVARATDELRAVFGSTGITELIGAERFYPTVTAAVEACAAGGSSVQG